VLHGSPMAPLTVAYGFGPTSLRVALRHLLRKRQARRRRRAAHSPCRHFDALSNTDQLIDPIDVEYVYPFDDPEREPDADS